MSRIWFALAVSLVSAVSVAFAQPVSNVVNPPLSPRNASYAIDARLDPKTRTITGSEVIAWRNITTRTVNELQFHLYWNAWRDLRSTWLREATLAGTTYNRRPDEWARTDVTSISLVAPTRASVDLSANVRFISPDDGNADDRTVMAVSLPDQVPPGGTATIVVKWTAHVPRTFARTGAIGGFFFIAQWFPKLGVLQDEGWNCHQFHAGTEFFSDYGVYDVTLTVPKGWPVGATGRARAPRQRRQHHHSSLLPGRRARLRVDDERRLRGTDGAIRAPDASAGGHATAASIPSTRRRSDATSMRPATLCRLMASGSAPIRTGTSPSSIRRTKATPTAWSYDAFTASTRWLVVLWYPDAGKRHDARGGAPVVAWNGRQQRVRGRVDGRRAQRFTARAESVRSVRTISLYAFRRLHSIHVPRRRAVPRAGPQPDGALSHGGEKRRAISTELHAFRPESRNAITHAKTALWLNTLERHLGWATLGKTMTTYSPGGKFRHPKPQDFFGRGQRNRAGRSGWFFDQTYRSSNVFDYGVEGLKSTNDNGTFHTSVIVRRQARPSFQ